METAVADAKQNCLRNGVSNCRFIAGDIRTVLSNLKTAPDVVIIDPPRVGMHKEVVDQVLSLAPEKIVYVSCNPSTLARDAAMLTTRYALKRVKPVDMFPHTYHIEAVARFDKL